MLNIRMNYQARRMGRRKSDLVYRRAASERAWYTYAGGQGQGRQGTTQEIREGQGIPVLQQRASVGPIRQRVTGESVG